MKSALATYIGWTPLMRGLLRAQQLQTRSPWAFTVLRLTRRMRYLPRARYGRFGLLVGRPSHPPAGEYPEWASAMRPKPSPP